MRCPHSRGQPQLYLISGVFLDGLGLEDIDRTYTRVVCEEGPSFTGCIVILSLRAISITRPEEAFKTEMLAKDGN